jgi:hypothetical protein
MTQFLAGQTYYTRSIGDSNCIITVTVARRTAKTITTNEGKQLRVRVEAGVEQVSPRGSYSMAPVLTAENTRRLVPSWERGADRPLAPELRSARLMLA